METITKIIRACLMGLLKGYQIFISPWLGPRCRFYPSCSVYAEEALHQHGIFVGIYLTIKRLMKCHPLHEGGMDPVPQPRSHLKL